MEKSVGKTRKKKKKTADCCTNCLASSDHIYLHRGEVALRIHNQKYDQLCFWEKLNE